VGRSGDGQPYLISENLKEGNNFLNLANAKYYLLRQGSELISIRNEGALERLSFATGYVVIDSSEIIDALRSNRYDIRTTVALSQEPLEKPAGAAAPAAGAQGRLLSVTWPSYTPNYRKAEVEAGSDGFLRISEVYYPGWKVCIDGKPVKIYRADGAWMAVNLHQGRHVVEMMPRSLYFPKALRVTSAVALLLCVYVLFLLVFGRRKKTA
jgi:hypothetical protein